MDEVFNIFDSDEFQDLIIQEEQIEDITIEKDETFDKLIIEVFHRKCDFANELIQNISTFGKKSDTQQFRDRLGYLMAYSSIFDSNVPASIVIDSDDDDKRYHQFVVHIDYRRYNKAKAIDYIRFFKNVVKIFSSIKGLRTDSSIRFSILDGPNVITVSSNKLLEDELYEVYPMIKHFFNDKVFMDIANKHRLQSSGVRSMMKKLSITSGVKNIHPHRLRAQCACELAMANIQIDLISKYLGHAGLDVVQRYVVNSQERLRNEMRKVGLG